MKVAPCEFPGKTGDGRPVSRFPLLSGYHSCTSSPLLQRLFARPAGRGGLAGRRTPWARSRTACNAWLTAASVGKARVNSGSRSTRLVPARYRATYFPRTPPFMDAKSYSGCISFADFTLFFFIKPLFMPCCPSRADDAHNHSGYSSPSASAPARPGTARLYAARAVSARLIHLAMSAAVAPMVRSARTIRSSDTERSAASILAMRD